MSWLKYITLEFTESEIKDLMKAMDLDPDFEVTCAFEQFPWYIERIALLYARDLIDKMKKS